MKYRHIRYEGGKDRRVYHNHIYNIASYDFQIFIHLFLLIFHAYTPV